MLHCSNEIKVSENQDRYEVERTYVCQCCTTASVESMIVPSISKRMPENWTSCGGAEKFSGMEEVMALLGIVRGLLKEKKYIREERSSLNKTPLFSTLHPGEPNITH